MTRRTTPLTPMDAAALERIALRYVERFATTRAKLATYLRRKLRERGWAGDAQPDVDALAERFSALGYVDDRAWGEAKAASMARRGLGSRRVRQTLSAAGVVGDDADAIAPVVEDRRVESAVAFARRRRIGPFGREPVDRPIIEKQIGQMVRAGHSPDLSRRIASMSPPDEQGLSEFGQDHEWERELILSLS